MTSPYQDALSLSIDYFNGDLLAAKVFLDKYALKTREGELLESTPDQMHRRLAKEFARIEANKFEHPFTEKELFAFFDHFELILPQGGLMFGIGNKHQYVSLSNCVVTEIPDDSYSSILKTDEQIVQLAKRRAGCGTDLSKLRPKDTPVTNAAGTSTGSVSFAERYSNSVREVGQNSRRGALMCTLDVHHPDIIEFITCKQDRTRITGANLSVRISDEFMLSVGNGGQHELRWPVDSNIPETSQFLPAKQIWDSIVDGAWKDAEPGVLFWDTILKNSPGHCYKAHGFEDVSVNPCSEIVLSELDSCRLMAMNLFGFVASPFTAEAYFDYEKFYKYAKITQRLMDDVVDLELECIDRIISKIESDPESENVKARELELWQKMRRNCDVGRRTGTGITGLGDALAAMGLKYDSKKAVLAVEKIYRTMKFACYESSIEMAKELGAFSVFDASLEQDCEFFIRFKEEECIIGDTKYSGAKIVQDMWEYGRRNIGLLTTAPAGSISIEAQTTSGCEPAFFLESIRRKKGNPGDKQFRSDFVDQNGDHWMEFKVLHPKLKTWMDITGETDMKKSPWYGCCAQDIDYVKRIEIQAAAQRHIDHSISSCLSGDSLIQTNNGLYRIDELCEGVETNSFQPIDEKLESINIENVQSLITEAYNNGLAKTITITLSGGRSITCTKNHKLAILNQQYELQWKMAADIAKTDIVVGRKGLKLFPCDVRHKTIASLMGSDFEYKRLTNSKDVSIPTKMTKELARFLGYMCSDGSAGVNGISLCQLENNVCSDFEEIVSNLFDISLSRVIDNRAKNELSLYNIVANSREVSSFVKWLGICSHNSIKVPRVIRLNTQQHVREFIKGCTLDGYVSDKNLCVMTSVSKPFLEQLQVMLLNLGIESGVSMSNRACLRKFPNSHKLYQTQDAYALIISNTRSCNLFIQQIGFAEQRKQEECSTKFKRTARIKKHGTVPDFGIRKKFRNEILKNLKSNRLYTYYHSMTMKSKYGMFLDIESLLEMVDMGLSDIPDMLLDDTYTFGIITDITSNDTDIDTFDISVPNQNSYIANGLISHNTINLPQDATVEDIHNIYMLAHEQGLKGITVYREGCRSGVILDSEAAKRPKKLPCNVYHTSVQGQRYFVLVGMKDGRPYEVFAGKNGCIDKKVETGIIIRKRKDFYLAEFDNGDILSPITAATTDEENVLTRLISLSLRVDANMHKIVQQLEKIGHIQGFAKCVARILKKYIPDGTQEGEKCPECDTDLIRENGCKQCKACGWSICL